MICPHCGAELPDTAKACPQCGSDEQTGWSAEAQSGGLDLPEEEFNYDDYVRREFEGEGIKPRGVRWYWWLVAVGLLVGFVVFWFGR